MLTPAQSARYDNNLVLSPQTPLATPRSRYTFFTFLFCLGLLIFFGLRASSPNRWSAWSFGDAQTMMAAQAFKREGFIKTRFLWVPQYSLSISESMDDEPVRHHAHGSPGDKSGVGPKRIYTHWPSWYSIPYGVLAKLGIYSKSIYQKYAATLSILALFIFYLALSQICSREISFLTILFYGLSPNFMDYSDSLATMPNDDLFRFAFVFSWIRCRLIDSKRLWVTYLIYFFSLLTTLDSVVFIPVFAVVFDLLLFRKINWRTWRAFFVVVLLAFGIQFAQNGLYMGWADAWRDWRGYFLSHNEARGLFSVRLDEGLSLLRDALGLATHYWRVFPIVAFFACLRLGKKAFVFWVSLGLAGIAFGILLPGKVPMPYEPRQALPFAMLTYAILVSTLIEGIGRILTVCSERYRSFKLLKGPAIKFSGLMLCLGVVSHMYYHSITNFLPRVDYPARVRIDPARVAFFDSIDAKVQGDKVFLQFQDVLTSSFYYRPGYGQVAPVEEYYSHGIVLNFPDMKGLVEDLSYFWKKHANQFSPIFLRPTANPDVGEISNELEALGFPCEVQLLLADPKLSVSALLLSPSIKSSLLSGL